MRTVSVTSKQIAAERAPRTQAERTALSDKAMLEAAVELILERGTEKTTLKAIGERAGYSRGLATYRFGSKAGLYKEVCRSVARRWISYLQNAVGHKTGIEAMCSAMDAYVRFVTESPDDVRVLHILFCEATSPLSEFRETAREAYQRQREDVEGWVRSGMAEGAVRADTDPASEAVRFVAYIAGITYLWLVTPRGIDFEKVHEDYKAQLRLALAP